MYGDRENLFFVTEDRAILFFVNEGRGNVFMSGNRATLFFTNEDRLSKALAGDCGREDVPPRPAPPCDSGCSSKLEM
jgi:hypothetical protein